MRSSTISALALSAFLVACGGSKGMGPTVVGHPDASMPSDAAMTSGPDSATPTDLASPWHDESYKGLPDGGSLYGVWNDEQGTVLAVGDHGTVVRSQNGGAFALDPSTIPNPTNPASLQYVYGSSPSNVFTVGTAGALWKWQGSDLTSTNAWSGDSPPTNDYFNGLWVAADGTAFATGDGSTIRRVGGMSGTNGSNWNTIAGAPDSTSYGFGIWGFTTAPGMYSIYVAGCAHDTNGNCTAPRIWHSTGGAFTQETIMPTASPPCPGVYNIWGSSVSDIYAACSGAILHSIGDGNWVAQNTTAAAASYVYYYGVGGTGPDDVYAVATSDANGTVIVSKHDAASDVWGRERLPALGGASLFMLSVTSTDAYAVGEAGLILHK